MAFAYCILHISAFVKKEKTEEKRKADRIGTMKKIKKNESTVRDNMRSNEKEIEEKVRKKCSLNGSKTLQDKETKAIEFVE